VTPTSSGRLALIGLDGATYRVLDPLAQAGVIPALSALRARGASAILRSTIPSYTPPGWVSMGTGVNPGRHGVFGFLDTTPQEAPRIVHSGTVAAPTLWDYVNEQGAEAGVFNVPISYPPVSVQGFMVSGGLASGWTEPEMPDFAADPEDGRLVMEVAGGRYPLDTVVSYENDWRSTDVIEKVLRVQQVRRRVLGALLERHDVPVVFAVFEGPDRLQHTHYQYFVEGSEWYGRPDAARVRDRVHAYFAELDRAVADLVSWAGPDGHVVVVSDHGAGPWEKTVNMNLLLSEWGYTKLPSVSAVTRSRFIAGPVQRLARKVLPRRVLHRMKAQVERGIDWSQTKAFASHVAEQGIHVNQRGVLPLGIVSDGDVPSLEDQITERLLAFRDPHDGKPAVDRVIRRGEVITGPHAARAPNLFPLCRDQRYELSDTLAARGPVTDHRDRPWGYHHVDGVFLAAGPDVEPGWHSEGLDIVDVLPTVMHLAGLAVPSGLDGEVGRGVLRGSAAKEVEAITSTVAAERTEAYPFSPEEEAEIEESLRGLGYIE
jgi:predicted AlkP superfamily phosphohydrolase/phosphomutase